MYTPESKPLANSLTTLLIKSKNEKSNLASSERVTLSEALRIVGGIVGCFPNGGANAGRSYLGALAAVLVTYPAAIVRRACDPIHGIPGITKFLPTPADVIGWCDREAEPLRRSEDRARAQDQAAGREADEALADDRNWRPTLEELRERYGPTWGLTAEERKRAGVSYSDDDLRRIYAKKEASDDDDCNGF